MRLQTSLSQEDQRSWRLNEEALAAAASDWPRAASKIRDNLDRLEASGAASPALIGRYRQLVDRGPDVLRAELFALTCQGQSLRSLHPLAGLLKSKRRYAIIRETPLR